MERLKGIVDPRHVQAAKAVKWYKNPESVPADPSTATKVKQVAPLIVAACALDGNTLKTTKIAALADAIPGVTDGEMRTFVKNKSREIKAHLAQRACQGNSRLSFSQPPKPNETPSSASAAPSAPAASASSSAPAAPAAASSSASAAPSSGSSPAASASASASARSTSHAPVQNAFDALNGYSRNRSVPAAGAGELNFNQRRQTYVDNIYLQVKREVDAGDVRTTRYSPPGNQFGNSKNPYDASPFYLPEVRVFWPTGEVPVVCPTCNNSSGNALHQKNVVTVVGRTSFYSLITPKYKCANRMCERSSFLLPLHSTVPAQSKVVQANMPVYHSGHNVIDKDVVDDLVDASQVMSVIEFRNTLIRRHMARDDNRRFTYLSRIADSTDDPATKKKRVQLWPEPNESSFPSEEFFYNLQHTLLRQRREYSDKRMCLGLSWNGEMSTDGLVKPRKRIRQQITTGSKTINAPGITEVQSFASNDGSVLACFFRTSADSEPYKKAVAHVFQRHVQAGERIHTVHTDNCCHDFEQLSQCYTGTVCEPTGAPLARMENLNKISTGVLRVPKLKDLRSAAIEPAVHVVVVDSEAACNAVCVNINNFAQDALRGDGDGDFAMLGLDGEWRTKEADGSPRFGSHVDVLTIATPTCVAVFQLTAAFEGKLADALRQVLNNPAIHFVGNNIRADITRLSNMVHGSALVPTSRLLDLSDMCRSYGLIAGNAGRVRLDDLAAIVLRVNLSKSRRNYDWSRRKLAEDYVTYAALDALVGLQIYNKVLEMCQITVPDVGDEKWLLDRSLAIPAALVTIQPQDNLHGDYLHVVVNRPLESRLGENAFRAGKVMRVHRNRLIPVASGGGGGAEMEEDEEDEEGGDDVSSRRFRTRLDAFHAMYRLTNTLSPKHPDMGWFCCLLRDAMFMLDYDDVIKVKVMIATKNPDWPEPKIDKDFTSNYSSKYSSFCRRTIPQPEMLAERIRRVVDQWREMPPHAKQGLLLNKAFDKEFSLLNVHIAKGCLSDDSDNSYYIKAEKDGLTVYGCTRGTTFLECMHKKARRMLGAGSNISVDYAALKYAELFREWNCCRQRDRGVCLPKHFELELAENLSFVEEALFNDNVIGADEVKYAEMLRVGDFGEKAFEEKFFVVAVGKESENVLEQQFNAEQLEERQGFDGEEEEEEEEEVGSASAPRRGRLGRASLALKQGLAKPRIGTSPIKGHMWKLLNDAYIAALSKKNRLDVAKMAATLTNSEYPYTVLEEDVKGIVERLLQHNAHVLQQQPHRRALTDLRTDLQQPLQGAHPEPAPIPGKRPAPEQLRRPPQGPTMPASASFARPRERKYCQTCLRPRDDAHERLQLQKVACNLEPPGEDELCHFCGYYRSMPEHPSADIAFDSPDFFCAKKNRQLVSLRPQRPITRATLRTQTRLSAENKVALAQMRIDRREPLSLVDTSRSRGSVSSSTANVPGSKKRGVQDSNGEGDVDDALSHSSARRRLLPDAGSGRRMVEHPPPQVQSGTRVWLLALGEWDDERGCHARVAEGTVIGVAGDKMHGAELAQGYCSVSIQAVFWRRGFGVMTVHAGAMEGDVPLKDARGMIVKVPLANLQLANVAPVCGLQVVADPDPSGDCGPNVVLLTLCHAHCLPSLRGSRISTGCDVRELLATYILGEGFETASLLLPCLCQGQDNVLARATEILHGVQGHSVDLSIMNGAGDVHMMAPHIDAPDVYFTPFEMMMVALQYGIDFAIHHHVVGKPMTTQSLRGYTRDSLREMRAEWHRAEEGHKTGLEPHRIAELSDADIDAMIPDTAPGVKFTLGHVSSSRVPVAQADLTRLDHWVYLGQPAAN